MTAARPLTLVESEARFAGRRFAGVEEHAAYLRDGGCEPLVEVLAAGR